MEQVTRVAVGGVTNRVAIEMGQSMKILDAREGMALCEVPDIYLIKEMEARGLVEPHTLRDVMRSAYVLAKEETSGRCVLRKIRDELILAAYQVEGTGIAVKRITGASSQTVCEAAKVLKGGKLNDSEICEGQGQEIATVGSGAHWATPK